MADDEPTGDAVHTKGLWNRRRDTRCVRRHLGIGPDGPRGRSVREGDRVIAIGPPRAPRGPRAVPRARARGRSMGEPRLMPGDARVLRVPRHRGRRELRRHRTRRSAPGAAAGAPALRPDQDRGGAGNPPRTARGPWPTTGPEEGYAAYVVDKIYVGAYGVAVRDPIVDDDDVRRAIPSRAGRGAAWWKPARASAPSSRTASWARERGPRRRRGGIRREGGPRHPRRRRGGGRPARGRSLVRSRSSGSPSDRRSIASNVTGPGASPCDSCARGGGRRGGGGQKRSETVRPARREGRSKVGGGDAAARRGRCRGAGGGGAGRGGGRGEGVTAPPSPGWRGSRARAEDAGACLRGWAKQTPRKPSETVRNGQRPSTALDRSNRRRRRRRGLDLTSAGRAKGLFAPVTRPRLTGSPAPRGQTAATTTRGTHRGRASRVAHRGGAGRGRVRVLHTRVLRGGRRARRRGPGRDRCGFERPPVWRTGAPCVELTRDGVGALRTADECGFRGVITISIPSRRRSRASTRTSQSRSLAPPLVLVLPRGRKNESGGRRRVPLGSRAALRASKRVVGVVCVSSGPEQLVRAVALAGACARGTAPFVPTEVFAAGLSYQRVVQDNPRR